MGSAGGSRSYFLRALIPFSLRNETNQTAAGADLPACHLRGFGASQSAREVISAVITIKNGTWMNLNILPIFWTMY